MFAGGFGGAKKNLSIAQCFGCKREYCIYLSRGIGVFIPRT